MEKLERYVRTGIRGFGRHDWLVLPGRVSRLSALRLPGGKFCPSTFTRSRGTDPISHSPTSIE
jgi:hypothetical protein